MFLHVLLGTIFGFVLSRSSAADYNYIQRMFLFEDFQLYGIIGSVRRRVVDGGDVSRADLRQYIGEGKIYALAALAGALAGTGVFGALYARLQAPFQLPPLAIGTDEG